MNETVSTTYASIEQARNIEEDLRAIGVPREKIFIDEKAEQLRVIMPRAMHSGIVELFAKHGLKPLEPLKQ